MSQMLSPTQMRFLGVLLGVSGVACGSYEPQRARDEGTLTDESQDAGAPPAATPTQEPSGTPPEIEPPQPYVWMPVEGSAEFPSDLTDLSTWRLTLPGVSGLRNVEWDQLLDFDSKPFFQVNDAGDGILFRAPVEAATTSGSSYPRTELREMSGSAKARWAMDDGVHTMEITQRITAVPPVKPHVVAGQIHDDADDVIMIRFEQDDAEGLFVESRGDNLGYLDKDYSVGEWFTVRVVASNGRADVYYKKGDGEFGEPVGAPLDCLSEGLQVGAFCYFKAGVYTQSNLERGDVAGAYGEVEMTSLTVTHQ